MSSLLDGATGRERAMSGHLQYRAWSPTDAEVSLVRVRHSLAVATTAALLSTAAVADPPAPATYTYDANGNRSSKTENGVAWTYVYDSRDLLREVQRDGVLLESYQYDGQGRRVRRTTAEGIVRYVWDGDDVVLETDDFGNTSARYTYGADRLLSVDNVADGRGFYLFDGLRSPAGIVRSVGAVQLRYEWDAWGNQRHRIGDSASPFGFTGHQLDEPTGLYYAGARYYDPEVGSFLTEDPLLGRIETPASLHRYLYAYGNPAVYWDPDGMESIRQWFDVEGDLMADRVAVAAGKYALYQAWNALTFGFLGEHDEVFETTSGGEYAARAALALGKAGTKAYVAAQTAGASLAFSQAAGLGTVATTTLTGASVGFTQTATDDVFNVVEDKPTHSAGDYLLNTAAGGAIGALSGGLVRAPAGSAIAPAPPPPAAVGPSAEAAAIRARVLESTAESRTARTASNFQTHVARTQATIVAESRRAPGAITVPLGMTPRAGYVVPQRQLTAGNPTTRTLAEVRALRGPQRPTAAEEYVRELYGAGPERHFQVPAVEGSHPITGTGGRWVDAPVDLPTGGVLAGEVKTYRLWRTVVGRPVRSGVPLSAEIEQQIHKELWLRRHVPGYDPRFITLDAPPTPELAALLRRLGIVGVHYGR